MTRLFHRLGFWLSLPVSAVQGLWLRRTAIRLPEAGGARNGVSGRGTELHLLALGDSIIAGVGTGNMAHSLPVQFARALAKNRQCSVHWHAHGANGAAISDLRQSMAGLAHDRQADVVLISIGVNDVTGLSSTRHWRSELEQLLLDIRGRWPRARVLFAGLPPMGRFPLPPQPLRFTLGHRAATLDAIAAAVISGQPGMLHIPTDINPLQQEFCEDGFHPSAQSCAYWANELASRFEADNLVIPGKVKGSK
ncbi:MAG TPA: SGNH/GDSL hydrolase family protein [Xanthomonadales bacterium]